MRITHLIAAGLALACAGACGPALAVLPPPSPAQAQAAAAKKAAADAQAAKDKAELAATMDTITTRWRSRAASQGWPVHPQVAVAAPPPAPPVSPAAVPIRSEKLGTAPPSADVKPAPSQPQPAGAPPTVDKHKK